MGAPAAFMAVASATSTYLQYQASQQELSAQKDALENEREYLAQQRVYLNEARDEEIDLFRRETKEILGLQTVGFAKSGVDLSGSASLVLNRTLLEAHEEEERILREYERARTLNEIEQRGVRSKISGVRNQQGLIPLLQGVGTFTSGLTGAYKGSKLT
jgi:hypothetical protein